MRGVAEHRVTVNNDLGANHLSQNRKPCRRRKALLYSVGIFVSYAVVGVLQEELLKEHFGPNNEHFNFYIALLVLQCLVNAAVARVLIGVFDYGVDRTAVSFHLIGSVCYSAGLISSALALRYVNYPTQIVAKSAKPLPVMAFGFTFSKRRYSRRKTVCVLLIVIGVAFFMYDDQHDDAVVPGSTRYGNALLLLSLVADGLLCVIQDEMRDVHDTKALHMMYFNNLISVLYLVIIVVFTQELQEFVEFVERFPQLYSRLILLTLTSAVGQIFIFYTIVDFGPLMCAIITTVRKFFTVLCSVFLFGTEISIRQWSAATVVFSGIIMDATTP